MAFEHPSKQTPKEIKEAREQRREFLDRLHTVVGEMRNNVHVFVEAACVEFGHLASAEHLSPHSVADALQSVRGAQDKNALGQLSNTLYEIVKAVPPAFQQKES